MANPHGQTKRLSFSVFAYFFSFFSSYFVHAKDFHQRHWKYYGRCTPVAPAFLTAKWNENVGMCLFGHYFSMRCISTNILTLLTFRAEIMSLVLNLVLPLLSMRNFFFFKLAVLVASVALIFRAPLIKLRIYSYLLSIWRCYSFVLPASPDWL